MGICTLNYVTTRGTGSINASIAEFRPKSDGTFSATIELSNNDDPSNSFIYDGHHLKSWIINYVYEGTGSTEYKLGSTLIVNSLTGDDVTYIATTNWESIYEINYTSDPTGLINSNRNITEYWESMGKVQLYPPVITESYRFIRWEYNGVPVTEISSNLLGSTSINLKAICSTVNVIGIYGRSIPEVTISDENRDSKYLLITNSLKANSGRSLVGTDITNFFNVGHSIQYFDYTNSNSVLNISCESIINEIYINTTKNFININLKSVNRANTSSIIHINNLNSLYASIGVHLFLDNKDVTTVSSTANVTISGMSTIVVTTDLNGNNNINTFDLPVSSIIEFINSTLSSNYLAQVHTNSIKVNFPWGPNRDTTKYGKYYTTVSLSDLSSSTYRYYDIELDNDVLCSDQYNESQRIKIRRFYELMNVTKGTLNIDSSSLDIVYDYIQDSKVDNDNNTVLGILDDIQTQNVPIKVVLIV